MTPEKAAKYLEVANAIAKNFSKDQSTKVGCVIVGPAGESRGWGYNGAPRGCSADEDGRGVARPEKYYWFSHSEVNAITNAARMGTPLEGALIFVTHPPCMECARAIVQSGITEVWSYEPTDDFKERWDAHISRTQTLFRECGVAYYWIKTDVRDKGRRVTLLS